MDTNNKTNTVVDIGDDGKLSFTQEEATSKINNVFTEFEYDKIPVVDLVNKMINDAVEKRASDVHFDPTPDVLNSFINNTFKKKSLAHTGNQRSITV